MRFNTLAKIYKIEKIKDGQGGYIENKTLYKDIYCHVSTLKVEKQIQLFGVTNYKSLNFISMSNIDIENFYILIGDIYYRPLHKPKIIKNKTYLTLDILEHAD